MATVFLSTISKSLILLFCTCSVTISEGTSLDKEIQSAINHVIQWQSGFEHNSGQRPFVSLSFAQSLDGKLARLLNSDVSSNYALSGKESLVLTHAIRSAHDGILIGGGTLSVDNPRLTNRLWGTHQPRPVVLDTSLSHTLALGSKMKLKRPIVCYDETLSMPMEDVSCRNIDLLPCKTTKEGTLDLHDVVSKLREIYGMRSIMVEGGCAVIRSFLVEKLADAMCITVAPQFIGSGIGICLPDAQRIDPDTINYLVLGKDVCLLGRPAYGVS